MDITSTTELARVNEAPGLQFIVGSFLSRYPPSTRRTYGYHLGAWFRWCDAHGIEPLIAQRGHIEAYGRHLAEERGGVHPLIGVNVQVSEDESSGRWWQAVAA